MPYIGYRLKSYWDGQVSAGLVVPLLALEALNPAIAIQIRAAPLVFSMYVSQGGGGMHCLLLWREVASILFQRFQGSIRISVMLFCMLKMLLACLRL